MNRFSHSMAAAGLLLVSALWVLPAQADEAGGLASWQAVPLSELDAQRGMGPEDIVDLDATVENNSASTDGAIGTNTIGSDAFRGASGLFNVIQNNGNNNAIQAAIGVQLNVTP